jgi:polyisoprenoid-binding protein YceI
MKNLIVIFLVIATIGTVNAQTIYSTKTGSASFFSKTSIRDINAKNDKVGVVLNTATNEMVFVVSIKNFVFPDALMQEHFNETYMESDKYPNANFSGKFNEKIDYSKDGVTNVTATGKLKIHNVEHEVTEKGTITIKDGKIILHAEFTVELKDYNIEIPKVVFDDIAKTILIKIDTPLTLHKK